MLVFVASFQDNIGLKVLNLAWNGFGDKGAIAMATALKTCTLVTLDLTCNRIGAEGFVTMVKALKDNDLLKHLDVSKEVNEILNVQSEPHLSELCGRPNQC